MSVRGASMMLIRGDEVASKSGKALRSFDFERMKMLRVRSLGGDVR